MGMFHYQLISVFVDHSLHSITPKRGTHGPTDPRPSVAFNDTQFCLSKTLSHIQEMAKTSPHDPKTPKHGRRPWPLGDGSPTRTFSSKIGSFDPHASKFGKISRGGPSIFFGWRLFFLKHRWFATHSHQDPLHSSQMHGATQIQDVAHHALDIMFGKVDIHIFIIHGGSFCSRMGCLFTTCGFGVASWVLMARRYGFHVQARPLRISLNRMPSTTHDLWVTPNVKPLSCFCFDYDQKKRCWNGGQFSKPQSCGGSMSQPGGWSSHRSQGLHTYGYI